jgi:hypothetical protein
MFAAVLRWARVALRALPFLYRSRTDMAPALKGQSDRQSAAAPEPPTNREPPNRGLFTKSPSTSPGSNSARRRRTSLHSVLAEAERLRLVRSREPSSGWRTNWGPAGCHQRERVAHADSVQQQLGKHRVRGRFHGRPRHRHQLQTTRSARYFQTLASRSSPTRVQESMLDAPQSSS